jgi:hypothetical protein
MNFDPSRRKPAGWALSVLLTTVLVALSGCGKPAKTNGIEAPSPADAQAAARKLIERLLADYVAAGETDPIGFLARRNDVDSVVVSTLQHTMSLDPRDPLRCDAKSAHDYRFEKATSVSPTRWNVGVLDAAGHRDSYTVEFGADGKWRLADINCT